MEWMHEEMANKILQLAERIERGHPLPHGHKLMDQEAEKELERIAKMYQLKIGQVPSEVIEKLISAFKKCLSLNFFWPDIKEEIEKAIKNLEKTIEDLSWPPSKPFPSH